MMKQEAVMKPWKVLSLQQQEVMMKLFIVVMSSLAASPLLL